MTEKLAAALETNLNPAGVGLLIMLLAGSVGLGLKRRAEFWPLLGWVVLLAFNFSFSRNFFAFTIRDGALFGTPINLLNQGSITMLLGIGMTLVIAVKGIDLSVGSVMALSGAICVMSMKGAGFSFAGAAALALLIAFLFGLANGALVAWLGIQPIVATLLTMVGGRGVAMLMTGAEPVSHRDSAFAFLGTGHFLGLPFSVTLVALVFAAAALTTRKTALGLFMESIGDNETASRLAGVPERRIKFWLYGCCGLCAGIAGLVAASYIATADPDRIGRMRELDAIFAAVVGGTALTGGRFRLAGTLLGALLIQTLSITMYSQQVPAAIAPLPKAVVIVAVCLLLSPETRRELIAAVRRGRQLGRSHAA